MLPRLKILQIGDVHLPGAATAARALDEKDPRFPLGLKEVISRKPIKTVFLEIYRQLERDDTHGVFFMGDLTDIGSLKGYEACANYIATALQLGSTGKFGTIPTGIVPGNHDIDRELAKLPDIGEKFRPLISALARAELPPLPVTKPIWSTLAAGVAKADIALLNSCWGCGAKEFIPAEFRSGVSQAIERALKKPRAKRDEAAHERAVRAYYDRQFDTPAFNIDSLGELASNPNGTAADSLLIACAHHNLLPQRTPRLAPYTELVNSGAIRYTLAEAGRPVLYLHGHIHEDPIEILSLPGGEPLVTISAPEASGGFNILEVVYTRSGLPLSCQITRWRFNDGGVFRPHPVVRVPLIGNRRRSSSHHLAKLYAGMLAASDLYWQDVVAIGRSIYSDDVEEQVEEALELLSSDGRVLIENYSAGREAWIIGARI